MSVAAANPHTVVVMIAGSAIVTEKWRGRVPAILMAWYPGMEGGHALADILLGKVNPSGKLPCVFAQSAQQLPFFDKRAKSIEYGYFHGQRLLDKNGEEPAFAFGFGLSYTTFRYQNLRIEEERLSPSDTVRVAVDVSNTGDRAGEEIVQLYVGYPESRVERPLRELKAFVRVALAPGETQRVQIGGARARPCVLRRGAARLGGRADRVSSLRGIVIARCRSLGGAVRGQFGEQARRIS